MAKNVIIQRKIIKIKPLIEFIFWMHYLYEGISYAS